MTLLGKTANGLFWMYRYLERAENTSRLIETGQRIALTRLGTADSDWRSVLQTAGVLEGFEEHHGDPTREAAINWMLRASDNPSSVLSSIMAARQNARLVRTALTLEVWEATNASYMQAREMLSRRISERDLPGVLGSIRQRTALVRGTTHGTMLRNDIYDFARIGTFLERADNTARILHTKYYVLLPSVQSVGSSIDNVQWESILRSVSAQGGFRMEYDNNYNPRDIAHFLILDRRMPRSLAFCVSKLRNNLKYLEQNYATSPPSIALAEEIEHDCRSTDIDTILAGGLHEFIQHMLGRLSALGNQIQIDYRFYE